MSDSLFKTSFFSGILNVKLALTLKLDIFEAGFFSCAECDIIQVSSLCRRQTFTANVSEYEMF